MTYRLAKRSDFATGLILQQNLYDYWGNVVILAHSRIESQSQEGSLLSQTLWVWEGHGTPTLPPKDTETPTSFRVWLELEIDSLRKLAQNNLVLPANFLSIIWRHSCTIENINKTCPWHPLAFLSFGSHPSNALRNAYACALVADRVAGRLTLPDNERRSIVSAALTMNWSIFEMQDRLSSSKTNPSASDMGKIKQHPEASTQLLKSHGLSNEQWLRAVSEHHEEPDGKGYPSKLTSKLTYLGAQILRACDRLIAMTASRRYRTGILTSEAMKSLQTFVPDDCGILSALCDDLGNHPPGGIWIDPTQGHLYLSLGTHKNGQEESLPISPDGAASRVSLASFEGLAETLHPEWDNAQYMLATSRLDAIETQPISSQ